MSITRDQAIARLDYDPETGLLHWSASLVTRTRRPTPGAIAGRASGIYQKVKLYGREYPAHRIAWLIAYDEWPDCDIDHINGDKWDNRLCNLRKASRTENKWNVGLTSANRTGVKGAHPTSSGRWKAQIRVRGKVTYLGVFDTKEAAGAAYDAAAKRLHGQYCYLNGAAR